MTLNKHLILACLSIVSCLLWTMSTGCPGGDAIGNQNNNSADAGGNSNIDAGCQTDCDPGAESERCAQDYTSIESCVESESECFQWTLTESCLAPDVCDPDRLICDYFSGDTCSDALVIGVPHVLDGSNFQDDFTNTETALHTGTSCGNESAGAEVFLRIDLDAGEGVVFEVTSVFNEFDLRVMQECTSGSSCLKYSRGGPLQFIAAESGTYFFVAEAWFVSSTGEYTLSLVPVEHLPVDAECDPDSIYSVCTEGLYCGIDLPSSTGYRCFESQGGDACSDSLTATTGLNNGRLQGLLDDFSLSCSSTSSFDQVWQFVPSVDGEYTFAVAGLDDAHAIMATDSCEPNPTELACDTGTSAIDGATFSVSMVAGTSYFLIVDLAVATPDSTEHYDYTLDVSLILQSEAGYCDDGADNDNDGLTDCDDHDCFGEVGACGSETNCLDGLDNDADGLPDCIDPDCSQDPQCPPLDGDSCSGPLFVSTIPWSLSGVSFETDFSDQESTIHTGTGCAAPASHGWEVVVAVTLQAGDYVAFYNTMRYKNWNWYVLQSCTGGQSCLVYNEDIGGIRLLAPATGLYYFIAESFTAQEPVGYYDFHLEFVQQLQLGDECHPGLTAWACPPDALCMDDLSSGSYHRCIEIQGGDSCASPAVAHLGLNPGQLQGLNDDFDTIVSPPGCAITDDGFDQVWVFTPTTTGIHGIKLMSDYGYLSLAIAQTCSVSPSYLTCQLGYGPRQSVSLTAGTPYYIYVDTERPTSTDESINPYSYTLGINVVQPNETGSCADGLDNDYDNKTDCADSDCFGAPGVCQNEIHCDDGEDNDADGLYDCNDSDCTLKEYCRQRLGIYESFWEFNSIDVQGWRVVFTPAGAGAYTVTTSQNAAYIVSPSSTGFEPFQMVDDEYYYDYLPFIFPMWGQTSGYPADLPFNRIAVSTNGWIRLVSAMSSTPIPPPGSYFGGYQIALSWWDLVPIQAGDLIHHDQGVDGQGRTFYALTYNAQQKGTNRTIQAQLVLFDDGEIRMDFLQNNLEDAIIGIFGPGIAPSPSAQDLVP